MPKIYSPNLHVSHSLWVMVCASTSTTFGLGAESSRLPACLSVCASQNIINTLYWKVFDRSVFPSTFAANSTTADCCTAVGLYLLNSVVMTMVVRVTTTSWSVRIIRLRRK